MSRWAFLLLWTCFATAQDMHYSQYLNVPLSLNPALTGKVNGTFRLGVNYRNQWLGLSVSQSTFSTPTFYGDVPVRFKTKDILGVGVNIITDRSAGGRLKTFSGVVSLAFHKVIGKSKTHFISLGLQGGYLQKSLDLSRVHLYEDIVLQEGTFITSADKGSLRGSDGGFDLHAGFDWHSAFGNKVQLGAGYAALHLTQPKVSLTNENASIPVRHALHADAEFSVARHLQIHPFFLYMRQSKTEELFAGLAFAIPFGRDMGLTFGGYYRVNDAGIPYVQLEIKGFKLAASYDFTVSELNTTRGGFELSLLYVGKYIPVPDVKPSMYCPRF
ncbi:MAG: hypothetical protein KatS3mg031_1557 [Chitinophagales bacterium]|nr:MAG: hypothetical protein KatS3mg031_1557 [Chitinophagales bacterium]